VRVCAKVGATEMQNHVWAWLMAKIEESPKKEWKKVGHQAGHQEGTTIGIFYEAISSSKV